MSFFRALNFQGLWKFTSNSAVLQSFLSINTPYCHILQGPSLSLQYSPGMVVGKFGIRCSIEELPGEKR